MPSTHAGTTERAERHPSEITEIDAGSDVGTWTSLRDYWDEDAATYDLADGHVARTAAEQAAWRALLVRLLPPGPCRILEVGAGTGALSLPLARLGHRVTALDISPRMLDRLRAKAAEERLEVETVEGPAERPPAGGFDVVVERLLLWTLRRPPHALAAWRAAAPGGHLLSFGGIWGAADRLEAARERVRLLLHRLRGRRPEHHAPYDRALTERLPFGRGLGVSESVAAVECAGWTGVRVERLRDVEWARAASLRFPERLLGVTPEFVVIAEDRAHRSNGGER